MPSTYAFCVCKMKPSVCKISNYLASVGKLLFFERKMQRKNSRDCANATVRCVFNVKKVTRGGVYYKKDPGKALLSEAVINLNYHFLRCI